MKEHLPLEHISCIYCTKVKLRLYLNLLACFTKLNSVKLLSDILVYILTFLGSGKWFEMQDLHTSLVLPEILPLSEAYIQIYERRAVK